MSIYAKAYGKKVSTRSQKGRSRDPPIRRRVIEIEENEEDEYRAPRASRSRMSSSSSITKTGKAYRKYGAVAGSYIGSAIGARFGKPSIGRTVGSVVGRGLGALVSKVTGNGDYVVHNSLIKGDVQSPNLSFGNGSIRIRHREYITDLEGSIAFSCAAFDINPGLPLLFPFLSQLADNFETYTLHGLVFEFKSMSADALNSTNTALGTIGMVCQYNSASADFTTKQQAECYEGAVSCRPSESFLCGVECSRSGLPLHNLYVRTGPVPAGQDQKTYDVGQLNIFTGGMQAASNVGELWVCYDITLSFPKLVTETFSDLPVNHYTATSGITTSAPMGTNNTANILAPGAICQVGPSNNSIIFNAQAATGLYRILYVCYGTSATANIGAFTLGSNFSTVSILKGDSLTVLAMNCTNNQGILVQYVSYVQPVAYVASASTLTFSLSSLPTSPTNVDLFVEQCNPLLIS